MKKRPNILYVLSDDLGYGDVSCLNPQSRIQTPRMDALAAQGRVFTDAHSNSAVCTPTRYGVLTGRYAWRGRLKKGVLWGYSPPLIEPGRVTVPSFLQGQGYRTACVGKWHLGLGWAWPADKTPSDGMVTEEPGIDYSQALDGGAHTVGFDESFVLPASLDMPPYCYVHNGRVAQTPVAQSSDSPRPPFWRKGAQSPGFEHENCLLELTRRAEAFIDHHALENSEQPFFLYFATPSPHTPHAPRRPFQGSSEAGPYGDLVVEHDWSIGVLLDALERNGMAEDTLVVVTSDNGAHMRGDDFDFERQYGHRSNHIYRGQKSDCWDGGHRVPFITRWPGQIPAGTQCHDSICLTDLLATAAELCGAKLPEGAGEDSVNMLPLLCGETREEPRPPIVHHSIDGAFAIRQGHWKLILCRGSGGWSLREGETPGHPRQQLYDMQADPEEQHNLIEAHPDIVAQLRQALNGICGESGAPL